MRRAWVQSRHSAQQINACGIRLAVSTMAIMSWIGQDKLKKARFVCMGSILYMSLSVRLQRTINVHMQLQFCVEKNINACGDTC